MSSNAFLPPLEINYFKLLINIIGCLEGKKVLFKGTWNAALSLA